jgi:hypothetical protein
MKAYIEFAEELSLRGRSLCDDLTAQGKVQRLGSGIGRVVYSHPKWPFLVFKYEFQPEPMSNQSEWDYWMRANDEQRQFLARPFYLSKNGHVIVMERVGKYTKDNPPPYNFYATMRVVDERMWDVDADGHNVGPSGTGPKLYDYADEVSTFWFDDHYDAEQSYYSECDCPDCIAHREIWVEDD